MWVIVLVANNVSKFSSCSEQISLLEIAYEFLVAVFYFFCLKYANLYENFGVIFLYVIFSNCCQL